MSRTRAEHATLLDADLRERVLPYWLGTVDRARQRARDAEVLVVTAVPVADLDRLKPSKEERKRADYLVYVLAPVKADSAGR